MPAQTQKYLSAREVSQRYGVGIATVWRWSAEGVLPRPIKVGPNSTRWSVPALEEHDARLVEQQAAG